MLLKQENYGARSESGGCQRLGIGGVCGCGYKGVAEGASW